MGSLVDHLRNGQQCDEEGIMCIVSRQACHEAADRIEALDRECALQAKEIDAARTRADKWQSMVLDCEKYLKEGETPAQRIDREIRDCLAMMKLLEAKQRRIEALEASQDALLLRAVQEALEAAARHAAQATGDVEVFNTIRALDPDEIVKKVKEEGNG